MDELTIYEYFKLNFEKILFLVKLIKNSYINMKFRLL